MSDVAIRVEGLGKKYQIGRQAATSIADHVRNLFAKDKPAAEEEFWALKDVSFEIKKGEAVGIIGKNGAGKSTLLKILSKITYPTTGRFEMNGRVSSLLEVGTGFHPELSGRENIFLNGTILGMTRAEIKSKFDEIVAFSGVEKFIDTPVKRYSSGMYVRLAFSVAAHLEPEILIIDEVLAVGDAEFQKKCLGKMDEVAKDGRTVIFVSHNLDAVQSFCENTILVESGHVSIIGRTNEVIGQYLSDSKKLEINSFDSNEKRTGNGKVLFRGFNLLNDQGSLVNFVHPDQRIKLSFLVEILTDDYSSIDLGFSIHDYKGQLITINYSRYQRQFFSGLGQGLHKLEFDISELMLNAGKYHLRGRIIVDSDESDWPQFNLGEFEVIMTDIYNSGYLFDLPESKVLMKGKWI